MSMKVKLQEVIEGIQRLAANNLIANQEAVAEFVRRIQQHGIEVPYTPMTEDDFDVLTGFKTAIDCHAITQDQADVMLTDFRIIEQAVLTRQGVTPSLDQAKQVCEQAGFAVVPKDQAGKYAELLYAVASAYPNETRHETALRYIRNAEHGSEQCEAAKEAK